MICGIMDYKALYKSELLIYGDPLCSAIIVTGWTPMKDVAKNLQKGCFAALGQLYSPGSGLSFLIRNLMYNPQICTVVHTIETAQDRNAGSIAALKAFFENGVEKGRSVADRECWKTIGARGEIEIEISEDAIDALRDRVKVVSLPDYLADLSVDKLYPVTNNTAQDVGNRRIFPIASVESDRLPGRYIGHKIEALTIAEAFPQIMHLIRSTGRIRRNTHGGYWQELINLMVVITDEPIGFKFEPYLPVDSNFMRSYIPQMCDGLKGQGLTVKYTYGSRMREYFGHDQIEEVIEKLFNDPTSCSAVVNLWDAGGIRDDKSSDHKHDGSPCLNHLWFRIHEGIDCDFLTLTATLRSNDMYSAWVSNAMGLRELQHRVCKALNDMGLITLRMGTFSTLSQSAHVYDHSFEAADATALKRSTRPTYIDPVGNFLVCWDATSQQCYIGQEYPQGIACKEFRGRSALKLVREVCHSSPEIHPSHAAYLALEVQKCLELKERYRQDS